MSERDVDELIARCRGMVAEAQPRDVLRLSRDDLSALLDAAQQGQEAERENERHRKANLVRAVIDGYGPIDETVSDLIHAESWSRIPWTVAERMVTERDAWSARCVELQHQVETLRGALEWYATDRLYRGHDPDVLYDVGSRARAALDGIDQGDGNA